MKEIDLFSHCNEKPAKSSLLFNNQPTKVKLVGSVLENSLHG